MAGNESPIAASRFGISVDGVQIATFSELQGITTKVDVIEFRESTENGVRIVKIPGATAPEGEVKFKMAMGSNLEMNAWLESAQAGMMEQARKSCSLVMYSTEGKPVARYHLEHAWPSKLEIGALKAGSSEVLMETVTIVSERIQRVSA